MKTNYSNKEIENKINDILNKLRPFLVNDGGNIELVKYDDHKAYVKFSGACANCGLIDVTLKDGIEMALQEEIPEIEEVINTK